MKFQSTVPMHIAKNGYIAMSVFFIAIGMFFIINPTAPIFIIGKIIGIAMLVFGGVKIVGFFSKDLYRLAFQYDLQFGILIAVLGLIIIFKQNDILNLICIASGITFLADSLFKIKIALESKKFGISPWWLSFSIAIATIISSLLVILRPMDSIISIMRFLGVTCITEGILSFCVAITLVRIVKNQKPDVIKEDFYDTN